MTAHSGGDDGASVPGAGLTRNQVLIWLGQEVAPNRPLFNELSIITIRAEVQIQRFHEAFQRMLDETDALRTTVRRIHGQPCAEIPSSVAFESAYVDLSGTDDVEVALDDWARAEADTILDLSVRPFASTLIKLGPNTFAWALLLHQILSDATSMSLVLQRVSAWYDFLSGTASAPSTSVRGFSEYVDQQRREAGSDAHAARERYWQAKLADPANPVTYYDGRTRGSDITVAPRRRREQALGVDLTAQVRSFASSSGIRFLSEDFSLFSVFCTALIVYLHRLSGHSRIVLGSTWQNRPRTFESTVGLFMEQDPFSVTIDPGDTFRSILKKVHTEALTIIRHLPYAAGNPNGRSYDVMLNYVKVSLGTFAGTSVDHRWYRPTFGDGSLQVQVHNFADRRNLSVSFDLSKDVFSDWACGSVTAHYLGCLTAMMGDPEAEIASMPLITPAERHQLEQWNRTERDYPLSETIVDLVEQQARARPDALAVISGEERLTYAELCTRYRALTRRLRGVGVTPGTIVGILLNRSADLPVGLLGILGAGGTYVPLDPTYPRERLDYMLADSGARVLLTEYGLGDILDAGSATVIRIDDLSTEGGEELELDATLRPTADDLAYILYTSGSTGRPKGVEISHNALTNFLSAMLEKPGCDASDSLLAVTTLSFDIAALELYLPLIAGGSVEIASRESAVDGRRLRALLDSGSITMLQATPATWRMLIETGWEGTPGLKALIGGEALPGDLVQPLLDRTASLWNMYGPTETTIWSSVQRIISADAEITVGSPIANTGFHIVDEHLQAVPVGIAGELLITGDGLARGYRNRPELTAERFVEARLGISASPVRAYRTGDLARFRADGEVVHLGRLDHQIKIRGFRIELGEIESVLAAHPAIEQAVVVAHRAEDMARLVAYFVPASDPAPTPTDLRRSLREALPQFMVPQQFIPLPNLPLTLNGKIDRLRLPAPKQYDEPGLNEHEAPLSPIEARVSKAFRDVLGVSGVGADADFFDLGGQSLLGLRLVARLSDDFGVEIPLQTLFDASTVRGLSERVRTLTSTSPELRVVNLEDTDLERKIDELCRSVAGGGPDVDGCWEPFDDAQVVDLLSRFRQRFGVAAEGLSILDFRSDPTTVGLARSLRASLIPPKALVVPLQPNGDKTPLFLIHAGGGYVFFYRALAARLSPDQPVYAIRAATQRDEQYRTFDQVQCVEHLALQYLDEIKAIQPEGPYRLGGACFGGVVAFEMAQQLFARGEALEAPVLLFDSFVGKLGENWNDYATRTLTSVAQRLGIDEDSDRSGLVRAVAASVLTRPLTVLKLVPLTVRSLARRGRKVVRGSRVWQRLRALQGPEDARSSTQKQLDTMRVFLDASLRLVEQYQPAPFAGRLLLLKASIGPDPEPLWRPWGASGLDVHAVPGKHLDMMEEPWVADTAKIVRDALK